MLSKQLTTAILLLAFCLVPIWAQHSTIDPLVRTLTVRVNDNWQSPPVIELNGSQSIVINFDYLDLNVHYFYYTVTHCDADWKPSDISESEYLDGFNNQPIEERSSSFNTYMNYSHYRFELPNNNIRFRLSGNYTVRIYDNANSEKSVAVVRFSVFEKRVNVGAAVTTMTDIDYNKNHQQLELQIDTRNYPIRNPQVEMKVIVTQNNRTDNEIHLNVPSYTQNNTLAFNHVRDLIFEAGNEFRRFEMTSYRYNGLNVERIRFIQPFYHVMLYPDISKQGKSYIFDQDQNGRFVIRNQEGQNADNEADYFTVHFSLSADAPLGNGKIYLIGEFNSFKIDPKWELSYDILRRCYSGEFSLKQGAYNYQYLFVPEGKTKGSTYLTEGDFYETENEYQVKVYHRPVGERFDRLVGYSFIKSVK